LKYSYCLKCLKGFEYRTDIERICKSFGFKRSESDYLHFLRINYFDNPELKKQIEAFIEPKLIIETFQHTIIESALLFEYGFDEMCDATIAVTVNENNRIFRLQNFRRLSEENIYKVLGFQTPEKTYLDKVSFIVDNNRDEVHLMEQSDKIRKAIYTDYARLL